MTHIVWDWNGTLFDDIDAVVAATNEVFVPYGLDALDVTGFRGVYTRPIWLVYERLLGRALRAGEWELLDHAFHESYHRLMHTCELAAGALATVEALTTAGHTHSLLSMWRHDRLVSKIGTLRLDGTFRRVDGLREAPGGGKARFLIRHVRALGVDPADVILIGDSADDAHAAASAGARVVGYTGGMQSRADLEALGIPVVDRLADVLAHV